MGTSLRHRQVPLVGLNCGVCHTGTIRDSAQSPRRLILGMPAHQIDLQSYQRFLEACGNDPRFNADVLIEAIRKRDPDFGLFDRIIYRLLVVGRLKEAIARVSKDFLWNKSFPPQGVGRVDTFSPYKPMFGFDMSKEKPGAADLPPLFNQKIREGLWLHWDGNNNAVTERNKSAAIGAGASEASLDLEGMKRVEDWIWELKPPPFPPERIDRARATRGEALYVKYCSECHALGGLKTGQVTPLAEVGTDPERVASFTAALAEKMNTLGTGRPWKFSHFRSTDGYANMPLDGVWLRAPYLHNGSVPTLRDLLAAPADRPKVFYRACDIYDYANVGFIASGDEAGQCGVEFDTRITGNSNSGHAYGTQLKPLEKDDLIEYMKTL